MPIATNDKATASVEIFAHNNILIVGNDPIASAKVGPSGGTVFAFRQAHFTTNSSRRTGRWPACAGGYRYPGGRLGHRGPGVEPRRMCEKLYAHADG